MDKDLLELKDLIDESREPYFVCLGSMKYTMDAIAPIVGSRIQDMGLNVIGTISNPVTGKNLIERIENEISKIDKSRYQVITIDAALFHNEHKSHRFRVENKGCRPGSGIKKDLPLVGEITIMCNTFYYVPKMFPDPRLTMIIFNDHNDVLRGTELMATDLENTIYELFGDKLSQDNII